VAGNDFIVNITGNVTGFDVAPINNLNNAIKTLPPSTQTAAAGGQQLANSFNQTAGSASSLNGPLNTVRATTQTTGQTFSQGGALATAFGSNLQRTGSAAGSLVSPLNLVRTTTQATGQGFTASGALANNYGGVLVGTAGKAQQLVGSHSALGNSFGPVQGGLTSTNTLLQNHSTQLTNAATKSQETGTETIGLGEKIGLLGGFITTTIGTVFGLVEGFTGLEAAQVAADRAQQRVNTSALAAQKAQDAYNKVVAKFGPDSLQAQEALANLKNKNEANEIAEARASVTQSRLNEAYVSFGTEVITVAGELAQMGSTVSILIGKLGGHAAAAAASAEASTAEGIAAGEAAIGVGAEGAAADAAKVANGEAALATRGLGLSFLAVAAPVAAAVALFVLIETNTFKMGDAFRATVTVIGSSVDGIINAIIGLKNQVVLAANGFEVFKAQVNNAFIDVYNSIVKAFNSIIVGARQFVTNFNNAFVSIYNFVVSNVVNPIITAWNTMLKGLGSAVASAAGAIENGFNGIIKPIIDGFVNMAKTVNAALTAIHLPPIDLKPLTDLQAHIGETGVISKTLKTQFDNTFQPIPGIPLQKAQTVDLQGGLLNLATGYVDVTAASHTYDSALSPLNSSIGKSAAATVAFYSEQKNLVSAVQNGVIPAITGTFAPLSNMVTGLIGSAKGASESDAAHAKLTGTLATATKAHKDYASALQDSISKTLGETQATAQQVINQQFATKALADTAKAVADNAAKEQTLETELTNATAIRNRYNAALIEGTNKFLELITKTQDAATAQKQYNSLLEQATGNFSLFNGAIEKTPKNMELVAKAALGDADAMKELQDQVNKLFDDFNKLGDSVASDLGKAMEKGSKEFKSALKDLSNETGIDFDLMKHDMSFKTAAGMSEAKDILQKDLGAMNLLIRGNSANIGDATEQMIGKLTETITKAGGEITPQWQKIFDDMRKIAAAPMDATGVANALGDIRTQLDAMGIKGPQVDQIIGQISGSLGGVGTAATTATGAIDPFNQSLQQAGQLGTVWQVTLQNITVAFNSGFTKAVGDAAGSLIQLETDAANVFTNISNALVIVAQNFNTAFAQAVAASNTSLVALQTVAVDVFANISNGLILVAQNFNVAFAQGAQDAAGMVNQLVTVVNADFQAIIAGTTAVAVAITTNFNQGAQNAAGSMNALTTNANGNFQSIIAGTVSVAAAFTTNFNKGAQNAAGSINSLTTNINGNIASMISATVAFATAITRNFNTGAQNAAGSMNALATNVTTNVNNMISRLNNVISEFNNIRASINNATSAVNSLISAINSIPTSKTVNINIIEHITQVVRQVIQPVFASIGSSANPIPTTGGATTSTLSTTPTTTTTTANLTAGRTTSTKRVSIEVKEPTIVKIGDREFLKFINRKLLELDLGAIS
jgi:hypothetical protein